MTRQKNFILLAPWPRVFFWILLGTALYLAGELLLPKAIAEVYAETLPIPALNRLCSGRTEHPLSHYQGYYLYLYRILFGMLFCYASIFVLALRKSFHTGFARRASTILEGLLFALAAGFFLVPRFFLPVRLYDEGLILTGGWQFALGLLPYRDFYDIYGPGQMMALGSLFALFGKSLLLAHAYDFLIRIAISLLAWRIVRPWLSPVSRILVHFSVVCWLIGFANSLSPVYPCLACLFSSVHLLARAEETDRPANRFLGGVFAGLAVLFRHDIGTLVILLLAAALWMLRPSTGKPRTFLRPVVFLGGAILFPLPVYGFLALATPFGILWRQLIQMPFSVFPEYRAIPYPSISGILFSPSFTLPFYLFPLMLVASSAFSWARSSSPFRTCVFLACLSAGGIPQALGRSDFTHLIPLAMPAIPLFFLAVPPAGLLRPLQVFFALWSFVRLPMPPRPGIPDSFPTGLAESIRDCPEGPVFIGNRNHDCLVCNQPGLYFLLDRVPGSYFYWFDPGVVTTAPIQSEIACELESKRIATIVLWDEPPHSEPNRSAEDSRTRILDPYIREHYRMSADYPPYSVWTRQADSEDRPLPETP